VDIATSLFIRGFGWGLGVGLVLVTLLVGWSAFSRSVNSI